MNGSIRPDTMKHLDLVLFGRQGSGKGTQGKYLAQRYDLICFITGDELRKLSKENSELGQKIKGIVEAGHLVPNSVVMEIIEHFMKHLPQGKSVLFDGIPRQMEQAQSFDALMKKLGRDFTGVVFEISEQIAIERLTQRRMCEQCKAIYPATYDKIECEACGGKLIIRSDDSNMESIQNRLNVYQNETIPVMEKYRKQNKIIEIDGEKKIEEVNEEVFKKLDPLFL